MLEAALGALFGAVVKLITDLLAQKRAEQTLKDLGAAQAEAQTSTIIAEIADDQARINAADRGGADDVARRMRERLDRPPA